MIEDMNLSSPERLRFLVGLNTGFTTAKEPDYRLAEFYARRSSPALHCAIVGNVLVPGGYGTNANTATISDSPAWRRVTAGITARGTLPGVQLANAWPKYIGARGFRSNSPHEVISRSRELVRDLGAVEMHAAFDALDEGTALSLGAGFRHVQVHAAHGYLFCLLVDSRFNPRASEALERLTEWAARLFGMGIETSIRFSLLTGDPGFDLDGSDQFHERLAELPFDFFDVSSGFYNIDKRLIYPARTDILRARRAATISLARRFPSKRFILSGRALRNSEDDLPANVHIGLCRDLIANPDFLIDPRRGCTNAGKCHYYSRGEEHVICPHWVPAG